MSLACAGAIGGSIWHFIKGARNSPGGERIRGAMEAVRMRAPVLGGGLERTVYSICLHQRDFCLTTGAQVTSRSGAGCSLASTAHTLRCARRKTLGTQLWPGHPPVACWRLEVRLAPGPFNGRTHLRFCGPAAGAKAIVRNAAVGGILLAMIEGVGIVIQKTLAEQNMGTCMKPAGFRRSFHVALSLVRCAAQQMAMGQVDMLAPPKPPPKYEGPSADSASFEDRTLRALCCASSACRHAAVGATDGIDLDEATRHDNPGSQLF